MLPVIRSIQASGVIGLLGLFLAAFTTVLRAMLGFHETRRQQALSFAAALFVIGFVAPGVSELLSLRPEGSSMIGAILGLTARPLLQSLMHLQRPAPGRAVRTVTGSVSKMRACISRQEPRSAS